MKETGRRAGGEAEEAVTTDGAACKLRAAGGERRRRPAEDPISETMEQEDTQHRRGGTACRAAPSADSRQEVSKTKTDSVRSVREETNQLSSRERQKQSVNPSIYTTAFSGCVLVLGATGNARLRLHGNAATHAHVFCGK